MCNRPPVFLWLTFKSILCPTAYSHQNLHSRQSRIKMNFKNTDIQRIPRAGLPPEILKQLDELNHENNEMRTLLAEYIPLRGDVSFSELQARVNELKEHVAFPQSDLPNKDFIEKELNQIWRQERCQALFGVPARA